VNISNQTLTTLLNAKEVPLTEFERHTEVTKDRFIAYNPREETIDTLTDMKKMRSVKLPASILNIKSDLDNDIDIRYAMIEYHEIKDRIYMRIIFNSLIVGKFIDDTKFINRLAGEISKSVGLVEFNLISDAQEQYIAYNGGVIKKQMNQRGTFDMLIGITGVKIGDVMQEIDGNVDVLIAPRFVRELEGYLKEAKTMLKQLEAAGITKEKEPRMFEDNEKMITQSEKQLTTVREQMFKDISVEERYVKLELRKP
jgi:hypothetical protein